MITPARFLAIHLSGMLIGVAIGLAAISALRPDHSDLAACRQSLSAAMEAAR